MRDKTAPTSKQNKCKWVGTGSEKQQVVSLLAPHGSDTRGMVVQCIVPSGNVTSLRDVAAIWTRIGRADASYSIPQQTQNDWALDSRHDMGLPPTFVEEKNEKIRRLPHHNVIHLGGFVNVDKRNI